VSAFTNPVIVFIVANIHSYMLQYLRVQNVYPRRLGHSDSKCPMSQTTSDSRVSCNNTRFTQCSVFRFISNKVK